MRRIETRRARGVAGAPTRAGERALPARVHVPRAAQRRARASTTRSTRRTRWLLAAAREEPADLRARLGGLDARQHVRRATASRGDVKNVHTVRTGIEYMMRARRLVHDDQRRRSSIGFFQIGGGIAGDFPICVVPMLHQDLQRDGRPALGLLLPDQRLDDELRLVLRRRAEREDHLGQARRRHAEVHHRVRRHDRRAADLRLRPGPLTPGSPQRQVLRPASAWRSARGPAPAGCARRRACCASACAAASLRAHGPAS